MLKTPRSNPDHHTIGQLFKSADGIVWYCDSADDAGYWFTNVKDLNQRKHIVPELIKHVYHLIYAIYPGHFMCALGMVDVKEMAYPQGLTWSDFWPDEEVEEDDLDLFFEEAINWEDFIKDLGIK